MQTICLFVVSNLKFYAQMLGYNNISGSWCLWCQMAPNQWNRDDGVPLDHQEEWTIYKLKAHKILVSEPVEIFGVVCFPLWGFSLLWADLITAKLQIKSGNTMAEDHDTLERSLRIYKQLWDSANLSYKPKVNSLLNHAPKQMWMFNGIGRWCVKDASNSSKFWMLS